MKRKGDITDCRSQEGIVVGLIDCIISICRVLPKEIEKLEKGNYGELTDATIHALQDLTQDKDVLSVLRRVHSRCIISDERADIFESHIEYLKKNRVEIKA